MFCKSPTSLSTSLVQTLSKGMRQSFSPLVALALPALLKSLMTKLHIMAFKIDKDADVYQVRDDERNITLKRIGGVGRGVDVLSLIGMERSLNLPPLLRKVM